MPASIIDSPRTRRRNSPSSPPANDGDLTHQREARPDQRVDARLDAGRRPVKQLDRPGLGRITPQQPDALQVGQVGMDGRRGGQADCLADVAHGRRVPVLRRVALDELEDLLLSLGQVHAVNSFSGSARSASVEHVFVNLPRVTDGLNRLPQQPPKIAALAPSQPALATPGENGPPGLYWPPTRLWRNW
jgi:hypothetical protein